MALHLFTSLAEVADHARAIVAAGHWPSSTRSMGFARLIETAEGPLVSVTDVDRDGRFVAYEGTRRVWTLAEWHADQAREAAALAGVA